MWPLVLMFVAKTVALDSECLPFYTTVSQCLSHQPIHFQPTSTTIKHLISRYSDTYRRNAGTSLFEDTHIYRGVDTGEETFIQCVVNRPHQGYEQHYEKCFEEIFQKESFETTGSSRSFTSTEILDEPIFFAGYDYLDKGSLKDLANESNSTLSKIPNYGHSVNSPESFEATGFSEKVASSEILDDPIYFADYDYQDEAPFKDSVFPNNSTLSQVPNYEKTVNSPESFESASLPDKVHSSELLDGQIHFTDYDYPNEESLKDSVLYNPSTLSELLGYGESANSPKLFETVGTDDTFASTEILDEPIYFNDYEKPSRGSVLEDNFTMSEGFPELSFSADYPLYDRVDSTPVLSVENASFGLEGSYDNERLHNDSFSTHRHEIDESNDTFSWDNNGKIKISYKGFGADGVSPSWIRGSHTTSSRASDSNESRRKEHRLGDTQEDSQDDYFDNLSEECEERIRDASISHEDTHESFKNCMHKLVKNMDERNRSQPTAHYDRRHRIHSQVSLDSTRGTSHYDSVITPGSHRTSLESREFPRETSHYDGRHRTHSRVSLDSTRGTSHYDSVITPGNHRTSLESREFPRETSHYDGRHTSDIRRGRPSLESKEIPNDTYHHNVRDGSYRVSLESKEIPKDTYYHNVRDGSYRVSLESKEIPKDTYHHNVRDGSYRVSLESKEFFQGIPHYDTSRYRDYDYTRTYIPHTSGDRLLFDNREYSSGTPYYKESVHNFDRDYSHEHTNQDTDENESAEGAAKVCHREVAKAKDASQAHNAYLKCLQKYLQKSRHDGRRRHHSSSMETEQGYQIKDHGGRSWLEDSLRKVDEQRYPKWKASFEDSPEDTVSEEVENAAVQCHHQSFRKAKGNTRLATKMYADCLRTSLVQVDYAKPQHSIESHELDSVEFVDHPMKFFKDDSWFDSSQESREQQRFGLKDLDTYPFLDHPLNPGTDQRNTHAGVNKGDSALVRPDTEYNLSVTYTNPVNKNWQVHHKDGVTLQQSVSTPVNSTRNYSLFFQDSPEDNSSEFDWFSADSHEIDSIELHSHSIENQLENDIENLAMECHKRSINSKGTRSATQEYKKCIQKKLSNLFSRDVGL